MPRKLAKRLPAYPLPALLTFKTSGELGCIGLVVDAKPEAVGFYSKFGFFDLELETSELGSRPTPKSMFLSIRDIKVAVSDRGRSLSGG